jgi:hypothetical protein
MSSINVKLFKPHPIQSEIIETLINPDVFFVTCVLGRQTGKSLLINNYAVWYSINNPSSKVLIAGPADSNIQKLYTEIKHALRKTGVIKSAKATKGQTEIVFVNESKILFKSANAEDTLRGESVDVLIVDEAAFVKQETFETILLPFLNVRGKKCLLASTPRGKNWLYDYYIRGNSNDYPKYKSFKCSSYENPYGNKEFLEMLKKTLSPKRYDQEILAEFVDKAALFTNIDDILILIKQESPLPNEKYWAGIDIGLLNDRSVISIINENGDLVNQIVYDKTTTPKLIENIINLNNRWNFRNILIEVNGQGLPIFQTLQTKLNNIEAFTTTSKSKQEIIDDLIYNFNMINFRAVNDTELRIELESFVFIQDAGQQIKYAAISGLHDDRVMSLAIAKRCYKEGKNHGIQFIGRRRVAFI